MIRLRRAVRLASCRLPGLSQPVVQVGHPVPVDDLRIIKQQRGPGVVTEVPDARAEHDRTRSIRTSSISPAWKAWPAMLPGVIDTSLSPARACAWASALGSPPVTKVNGASGNGQPAGG